MVGLICLATVFVCRCNWLNRTRSPIVLVHCVHGPLRLQHQHVYAQAAYTHPHIQAVRVVLVSAQCPS